ncbi:IS481 family transposase [Nonomuraea basaltis]|nr:IS481 family transposase [Nonomuraea basaltis]
MEVRDGSPVTEVAVRYGVSRQTIYAWRERFERDGVVGLQEASRRPRSSPSRIAADIEVLICELRRAHRRWGARRICFELGRRGVDPVPAKATVHRVLTRNGLVNAQDQEHKRKYRRWQREAPMQLWQLDIVGGVFLADGRECKLVTGIDDHSRFVVIAALVVQPTGRATCEAFTEAMRRYGVPAEVLTDNGKQFTGRFTKPVPAEVMFERLCRENGISQRLTKRRSPTTTGKIERWHRTLREELLDQVAPFESFTAAQEAITAWVHIYNHARPHQALDMACPAALFRPNGPSTTAVSQRVPAPEPPSTAPPLTEAPLETALRIQEPPAPPTESGAVEQDRVVPGGGIVLVAQHQQVWLGPAFTGRTVTLWIDERSIHVTLDGHHVKTVSSRLTSEHLRWLRMHGARPASPAPAAPALPSRNGRRYLPAGAAVEVDRTAGRDGCFRFANNTYNIGPRHVGQRVTLRLDEHLMHAIINGQVLKTWPLPIPADQRASLAGARPASAPLPPPPTGPQQATRRVPKDGVTMVANHRLRIGRTHAGKQVTIFIEDTHFRVMHGDQELSLHPRNLLVATQDDDVGRRMCHSP